MSNRVFPYRWNLADGYPSPGIKSHKSTVFSCFAGTGGSTMGYKLAGYDVIGCNEIDPKMFKCYEANHHPKHPYQCDIRQMVKVQLPEALFNLDILDGSPPCSTFSMAGEREKGWGTLKVFSEGQAEQILDELYFHFIDLAKHLQPKIIVTENVEGILRGGAKKYVSMVCEYARRAGYVPIYFVLDGSRMGLPQRRRRFFLTAIREDLLPHVPTNGLLGDTPALHLNFNAPEVPFRDISDTTDVSNFSDTTQQWRLWHICKPGCSFSSVHPKGFQFNHIRASNTRVLPTLPACSVNYHSDYPRALNPTEICLASSFPLDYQFVKTQAIYACGMSVPPIMIAGLAHQIYRQWLRPIKQVKLPRKEPVVALGSYLTALKVKHTLNEQDVPGKPDAVITHNGKKIAVFVDSCFWHGCPEHYRRPSTNVQFWDDKINNNKQRDEVITEKLRKDGWRVVRLWEHNLTGGLKLAWFMKVLKSALEQTRSK